MTALSFNDVALSVDGRALFAPLTAQVESGDILCLTGPSGCGKSSLLKFACGFLPEGLDARGRVLFGADDLTLVPPPARRLGLLFQDALLFAHLSVADNVAFGLAAGGSRIERRARVDEALSRVGLAGFGSRDPATLSGGQRARVALLRVLLSQPRALLLDEPFSALDPANRDRIRTLVFERAREYGLPTVLVTHDPHDVRAAGGRHIELAPAEPA